MEKKKKEVIWQYVRGFCIVLVVLIHTRNGRGYVHDSNRFNFNYWLTLRSVINFPVSVFIFLAGYFTNLQRLKDQPFEFMSKRLTRLAVPFVMWSAFYVMFDVVFNNRVMNPLVDVREVLLGTSRPHLYYILVIIQFTLLTPILFKLMNLRIVSRFIFWLTPLYLLGLYYYVMLYGSQFSYYETFFPAWLIFFYSGLYVRHIGRNRLFTKSITLSVLILLVTAGLSITESYFFYFQGYSLGFASSQIQFSSFLLSFAVINLIFVLRSNEMKENLLLRLLAYLGDHSFSIYFSHMIWIFVFNELFAETIVLTSYLPLYQILQVIFTLAMSVGSIELAKRIFTRKISSLSPVVK